MVLKPCAGGLFVTIEIFTMFTMTIFLQLGDYPLKWVLLPRIWAL